MKKIQWIAIIIIFASFLILCAALLSGCRILKTRKEKTSDSTNVSKTSSNLLDTSKAGGIKKNDNSTKENSEWWRTTVKYQDTGHNVTNVYPSTIVYEGGKGQKESKSSSIDSGWINQFKSENKAQFDSMQRKLSDLETEKKSSPGGMPLWFWLLIAGVGFVLYEIAKVYFGKFKIVKKIV